MNAFEIGGKGTYTMEFSTQRTSLFVAVPVLFAETLVVDNLGVTTGGRAGVRASDEGDTVN